MNRPGTLAQRRERLVARSAVQRTRLIAGVEPLLVKAAALDRIIGTLRRYSVVAGAVALLGSRKLFDLGERLLTLYLLVRRRE